MLRASGRSPIKGIYDADVDRESAFEVLKKRAGEKQSPVTPSTPSSNTITSGIMGSVSGALFGTGKRQGLAETMVKSVVRSVGSSIGREIMRGLMGSISGGSKR